MSQANILIVDDRLENIVALSKLIEADDVRILSAQNAEEALDLLVKNDFALALLDVQMPGMTGFELAHLIRGVKRFRNLPMIFVTAHQRDQSVIFEGYETGAVDLLFKPLDPHVVRSKVRVFVQLDQQAKLLRAQMDEVERLRQEAEGANLAKSRFLANMSHEIRTPLAAVLGFADVLSHNNVTETERQECMSALSRNGQLLLKIIDDILDLSKVEAGRMQFDSIDFDLREIVRDIESTLLLRAQEKGIDLHFAFKTEFPAAVHADPIRIKQVLLNVIGNAIKFTESGGVSVEVEGGGDNLVRFLVRDSGLGLSSEQAARLFQPFTQADSSTSRIFGGTGLGLLIARKIARALGGDVKLISSQMGKGSVFEAWFRLPASKRTPAQAMASGEGAKADPRARYWPGKSILVVDDSPDNRSLIELYLKSTGLTVLQASGGNEALKLLRGNRPDVILMDIQMPEKDGHQTTREARQLGVKGPIIAFTAHAMREEMDRCLNSGCNSVLTKPISRDALLNRLADFL